MDINNYLAGLVKVPTGVKTLADLITFNTDHADLELIPPYYTSQAQWVLSHKSQSCMDVEPIELQINHLGRGNSQRFIF